MSAAQDRALELLEGAANVLNETREGDAVLADLNTIFEAAGPREVFQALLEIATEADAFARDRDVGNDAEAGRVLDAVRGHLRLAVEALGGET